MGYSDRDNNRSGGGRNFGGGRGFDRPTLHKAVCHDCGRECEVPFRPTGSKPVFCRDCFAKNGGSDARPERRSTPFPSAESYHARPNRDNDRDNDSRRSESSSSWGGREERTMYGAICDKCGKNCKIPFEPTSGRPVFCSNCFEQNGQTRTTHTELSYKQQFEELNSKMDKILALLTLKAATASNAVEKESKKATSTSNVAEANVAVEENTVAESNSVEEEVKENATSDVAVEESKAKKPKTKATLAAAKKRSKASPKKK